MIRDPVRLDPREPEPVASKAAMPPSTSTVMEGVARWHMADPARRRFVAEGQGHLILVRVTTLEPDLHQATVKFFTPEPAEDAHHLLNYALALAKAHPHAEVVNAGNHRIRFNEDTGEVEP